MTRATAAKKPAPVVEPREPIYSRELANVLADALIFADRSGLMPAIDAVLLEASAGKLTAVATDRYCMGLRTMAWGGPDLDGFLLRGEDAADLIQVLRSKSGRKGPGLEINVSLNTALVVEVGNITVRCEPVEAEFPKYRTLLEKAAGQPDKDAATFAVNPKLMARFGRLSLGREPMRVRSSGREKPISVRIGDDFIGLLMPVRMASYSDEVAA